MTHLAILLLIISCMVALMLRSMDCHEQAREFRKMEKEREDEEEE